MSINGGIKSLEGRAPAPYEWRHGLAVAYPESGILAAVDRGSLAPIPPMPTGCCSSRDVSYIERG